MSTRKGFYLAVLLLLCSCQQSVQPVSLKGDLDSSLDTASDSSGDLPAGPRRWRVAFVVDASQSMIVTDAEGSRRRAVAEVVSGLSGEDVAYGFLLMNQCLAINSGLSDGFVYSSDVVAQALTDLATAGSGISDLQSGLEAARRMIQEDIYASTATQLARTTYDLILVVDGVPSLVCDGSCGPIPCEDGGLCVPCDAGVCPTDAGPSPQSDLCDLPRARWDEGNMPVASCAGDTEPYPFLRQCEPYNVSASLEPLAAQIVALQEQGASRVRLSVFLIENAESPEGVKARALLQPLAEAARGSFSVVKASELSFVELFGLQESTGGTGEGGGADG